MVAVTVLQPRSHYLLFMPSKLYEHADLVAMELKKGLSYAQIIIVLSANGCVTTRQNLTRWLNRRAKRIDSRLHLIDPASAIQALNQQDPPIPVLERSDEQAKKETVADVPASASPEEEVAFIPRSFRRSSVVKPPLSPVQLQMKELARQAGLPAPLVWKDKKNV